MTRHGGTTYRCWWRSACRGLPCCPPALKQAWQTRRQTNIGFLLLWLWMPLFFFSLSKGKLPAYILPCLLPLALLLGHALADRLKLEQGRALGINGLLNLAVGVATLLTPGLSATEKTNLRS